MNNRVRGGGAGVDAPPRDNQSPEVEELRRQVQQLIEHVACFRLFSLCRESLLGGG